MAQYKKKLKSKVLNALVFMENPKGIKDLIDKIVKINNKIYQREQANKGRNKQILMQKTPQQALKSQYKELKPINFNGIKKS